MSKLKVREKEKLMRPFHRLLQTLILRLQTYKKAIEEVFEAKPAMTSKKIIRSKLATMASEVEEETEMLKIIDNLHREGDQLMQKRNQRGMYNLMSGVTAYLTHLNSETASARIMMLNTYC